MDRRAFTLVEILVCIAIAALLYALIFPTTSSIVDATKRHETRARFRQWMLAMEEFCSEYGYLPNVDTGGILETGKMLAALTACDTRGRPVADADLQGNIRRIRFRDFADGELLRMPSGPIEAELVDGQDNSQIGVMVDRDGDGVIRGEEVRLTPISVGNSRDGYSVALSPPESDVGPLTVIAGRVAFYSAGSGTSAERFVYSWR